METNQPGTSGASEIVRMNVISQILVCEMEELSEVQKELAKCLRFGMHNFYGPYGSTNWERVVFEFADCAAILLILEAITGRRYDIFHPSLYVIHSQRINEKIARTLGLMQEAAVPQGIIVDVDTLSALSAIFLQERSK